MYFWVYALRCFLRWFGKTSSTEGCGVQRRSPWHLSQWSHYVTTTSSFLYIFINLTTYLSIKKGKSWVKPHIFTIPYSNLSISQCMQTIFLYKYLELKLNVKQIITIYFLTLTRLSTLLSKFHSNYLMVSLCCYRSQFFS